MIIGMLRIRNEARWIKRVIESILPLCSQVVVMDDHSTDQTREICRAEERVTLLESPFEGLDESRDKNWLFHKVAELKPEWILAIDGDEMMEAQGPEIITETLRQGTAKAYSLQVMYLWDRPDQIRTDGVYRRFRRPSLFRCLSADHSYRETCYGGHFHCSNVPQQMFGEIQRCSARLLHFGYMSVEDRARKFEWYNRMDPNNESEDGYRHIVQGDPGGPPSTASLLHAGPLTLESIDLVRQ